MRTNKKPATEAGVSRLLKGTVKGLGKMMRPPNQANLWAAENFEFWIEKVNEWFEWEFSGTDIDVLDIEREELYRTFSARITPKDYVESFGAKYDLVSTDPISRLGQKEHFGLSEPQDPYQPK